MCAGSSGLLGADDESGVVGDLTLEALGTEPARAPSIGAPTGVAQAGQAPGLQPGAAQVAGRLVARATSSARRQRRPARVDRGVRPSRRRGRQTPGPRHLSLSGTGKTT